MKKFLSFLLVLSLIASLPIMTASAATVETDVEKLDFYAAKGITVTATDSTEPVDLSACVAEDFPQSDAPVACVDIESLDFYAAEGITVTATDSTEPVDTSSCMIADPVRGSGPVTRATVWDLSSGSTSINWDVPAEQEIFNSYHYKTNTQTIKIHLTGNIGVSLTVKLYSSNGTLIGTANRDVGTILGTDYTFTGLSATQNYYFSIRNNSPRDVTVTGSVSQ